MKCSNHSFIKAKLNKQNIIRDLTIKPKHRHQAVLKLLKSLFTNEYKKQLKFKLFFIQI